MKKLIFLLTGVIFLYACVFLYDSEYLRTSERLRGTRRVAVFVQRWPCYLQLPRQNSLGDEFIKTSTLFYGPWEEAANLPPHAVDVQDIDDCLVEEILVEELQRKGYQPETGAVGPIHGSGITVAEIMARYQLMNSQIQAFLFCFYSPTLFVSDPRLKLPEPQHRPYSLVEIIQILNPGGSSVLWAGQQARQAPPRSISHAFIYVSLTLFSAWKWEPLWMAADSKVSGKIRPYLPNCPPEPSSRAYPADAELISHLISENLRCRLQHLAPDAF